MNNNIIINLNIDIFKLNFLFKYISIKNIPDLKIEGKKSVRVIYMSKNSITTSFLNL